MSENEYNYTYEDNEKQKLIQTEQNINSDEYDQHNEEDFKNFSETSPFKEEKISLLDTPTGNASLLSVIINVNS
jgi:hypothetical protein